MSSHTCDVLVVGAGIIGATTALVLADARLTVLCTGPPAATVGTASSAAGAMLGVLGEVTTEHDPADGSLDDADLRLRHRSNLAWPGFAARLGDLSGHTPVIHPGTAVIASARHPGDCANLTAIRAAARRLGLPCDTTCPDDVAYLSAAPGHPTIGALWVPAEAHVDTTALLPALEDALGAHPKIHRLPHLVRRVEHRAGRATGAVLDNDDVVHSGQVVLAAGTATQDLLDDLDLDTGVGPRLLPGKGTSLTLHVTGHTLGRQVIRTPNREFACGTHLIGRADGGLYLGATNRIADTPGADHRATAGEIAGLLDSAIHEINTGLRTAAVTSTRYGMRPLSTDGYPLIGPTDLAGLHLATGTYRNGVLLAPAVADIITASILETTPTAPNPFRPTAPGRTGAPDVATLLQAGVPQIVSFLLKPHGQLPYNRQGELEAALLSLFRLAFTDDTAATAALRAHCQKLLSSAQVAEVVPQAFYALAASGTRDV